MYRSGQCNPRFTHEGKRELVTVIEMVGADRSVLSPNIINKGAGHYIGWYKSLSNKEMAYKFIYSPKG